MYNIDKPQERRKATGTGGIPPENIRLRRTLTTEYLQLSLCYGVRDRMSIETAGFTAVNCTPFVRQYGILSNKWGVFLCPKGVSNKRYTPEFKKLVIETMQEEKLSYSETCRRFEVNSRDRIKSWERIYLEEGPEGFAVERRGRSSKGRPPKQLPKQVEEDLLAEVQRLRAENDYLKNLQALVLEDERHQHKKRW